MRLPIGLGFKLGALVALILATFSASWWLVHHELGVIERLYSRVVNVHDPALDAAYKMHLVHASIGLTVSDALAGTASAPAQRLDAARDDFARNLAVLRNLSDLGARPQLDELATLHAAYLAQAERLIALGLQRDEALAAVVARVTAFKGVLVEALLPTALPPRAAAAMHAALDRMDNAVNAFVLHPNGRSAWRVDEALKYFQRDLSPELAPDATPDAVARAVRLHDSADAIDLALRAAMRATRTLEASLPSFDEQARAIDYRLSSRFEPTMREAMRDAASAALTRIRVADERAAWLLGLAALVGSVVAYVVLRHVLWPLRQLLLATGEVAAGNYRAVPAIDGQDELAKLGEAFARMARSLEQTTISRTLFDDVLRSLDEALFVTDDAGRIELANRAAATLTGWPLHALAGRPLAEFVAALELHVGARSATVLHTTRGSLPVLAGRSPLAGRDARGRQVVTALDDSARRAAEQALASSRDELQALHASQARRLEAERATLARELHDELGASLTTMKTLLYLATSGRRDIGITLEELGRGIDDMSDATTRIVNGLRPPVLDHFGLVAALDWYVREFVARTGITCEPALPDSDIELPAETALALFRAAQECLTNVSRHAQARRVELALHVGADTITLDIADDGIGCSAARLATSERFGLLGLRERLRALGGSLTLDGRPGYGLRVVASAPCPAFAAAA